MIRFEQAYKCRTYFVFDKESLDNGTFKLLGFYSLAPHTIELNDTISASQRKKMDGINKKATDIKCWLIGQLAKNENYNSNIEGARILMLAEESVYKLHELVGLKTMLIECENSPKLKKFYTDNEFIELQVNENTQLIQMVKIIK